MKVWTAMSSEVRRDHKDLFIAKVDCKADKFKPFCHQHSITHFPTLAWFKFGKIDETYASHKVSVESLKTFVFEMLNGHHYSGKKMPHNFEVDINQLDNHKAHQEMKAKTKTTRKIIHHHFDHPDKKLRKDNDGQETSEDRESENKTQHTVDKKKTQHHSKENHKVEHHHVLNHPKAGPHEVKHQVHQVPPKSNTTLKMTTTTTVQPLKPHLPPQVQIPHQPIHPFQVQHPVNHVQHPLHKVLHPVSHDLHPIHGILHPMRPIRHDHNDVHKLHKKPIHEMHMTSANFNKLLDPHGITFVVFYGKDTSNPAFNQEIKIVKKFARKYMKNEHSLGEVNCGLKENMALCIREQFVTDPMVNVYKNGKMTHHNIQMPQQHGMKKLL